MTATIACATCGGTFEARYQTTRFCSDACRVRAWRRPGAAKQVATGITSVALADGNVRDTCHGCGGIVIRAASAPRPDCFWCGQAVRLPRPPVAVRHLAELACLLCARFVGMMPIAPHGLILAPRSLRCATCGGRPVATGEVHSEPVHPTAEARRLFHGDPFATRRGRPPRAVAEARLRLLQEAAS